MTKCVFIAAGGTGGHVFPAAALAAELQEREWSVHWLTDARVQKYDGAFHGAKTHVISSATFARKSPLAMLKAGLKLALGCFETWRFIRKFKPDVIIGFGGYPTFPPLFVGQKVGVKTCLHEQNAVLGRANKALLKGVEAIALSLPNTHGVDGTAVRAVHTGNPVRPAVIEAAEAPYPTMGGHLPVRLLVFGGSQGASFLSDLLPRMFSLLPEEKRNLISIVQQCRTEDLGSTLDQYRLLGMTIELETFFSDLPERIAHSHLVISRAGASTVSELSVIGRPAILIPYPGALDHDQKLNAETLAQAGGAWVYDQADLTPEILADHILRLLDDPQQLWSAADAAKATGHADAAERLADLVEDIATNTH